MLAGRLLKRIVRVGSIDVIDADGRHHAFSGAPGPAVTIRLHDRSLHTKLYLNPDLYLGEAYMDGTLTIEEGTLYDFLTLCLINLDYARSQPFYKASEAFGMLFRRLQQRNPARRARAHAAHHYDRPDRLYDLFLDRDRQYSCAYFVDPDDDLETAQQNKKRHLAAKLLLEPGQRILDIGSGWGGLALYLAGFGAERVVGITLSRPQLEVARRRAAEADLADRVHFHLRDYREEPGTYDRIVSVGMFEHVGVDHYGDFFGAVRERLADGGVCVLHSIGRMAGPDFTDAWIRKHIFPGGYEPALSEVLPTVERAGLWLTDLEILRLHYAETLRHWRQRFQAGRASLAELCDERFCRMWEFYLTASELAFRVRDRMVFQMQLAKRRDAVPLTRDYITDWERTQARQLDAATRAAE
ncbi:MAG: class I SAM-dependent methyltransferase [Kiloniellales bacterium]